MVHTLIQAWRILFLLFKFFLNCFFLQISVFERRGRDRSFALCTAHTRAGLGTPSPPHPRRGAPERRRALGAQHRARGLGTSGPRATCWTDTRFTALCLEFQDKLPQITVSFLLILSSTCNSFTLKCYALFIFPFIQERGEEIKHTGTY